MNPISFSETKSKYLNPKKWSGWVWGILFVGIALGLASLSMWSSSGAQAQTEELPGSSAFSTAALGINVLFKLGIVVLLIYASLYILRRFQSGKLGSSPKQLSILETTHLSPRQALHLVKVGEQVILLGATDQSLSLLAEVELGAPDEAAQPEKAHTSNLRLLEKSTREAKSPLSGTGFASLLSQTLLKR